MVSSFHSVRWAYLRSIALDSVDGAMMVDVFASLATVGIVGGVTAGCLNIIWNELRAPRLSDAPGGNTVPRVSVVVPARNEASRIGPCMQGLARQHYADCEVIVVDDHSTDDTAAVVRAAGAGIGSLRIIDSAPLPDGWAGKCWACWQGAQAAQGEWLLFLDADVEPAPNLVAALVRAAQHTHADLVTLMPMLHLGSIAERLVLPAFVTILLGLFPLHHVSNPASALAFANGQCIFISRRAYRATDGHRGVANSVLEDTILGQRVKAAGFRLLAASAPELLKVRMYTNWRTVAEGLRKNATAGYSSGGLRSAWVGFRQMLIAFGPLWLGGVALVCLALGEPVLAAVVGIHAVVAVLLAVLTTCWLFARRHRLSPLWGALYPLGLALYLGIAATGFLRVYRGQGVIWKDRVVHE